MYTSLREEAVPADDNIRYYKEEAVGCVSSATRFVLFDGVGFFFKSSRDRSRPTKQHNNQAGHTRKHL